MPRTRWVPSVLCFVVLLTALGAAHSRANKTEAPGYLGALLRAGSYRAEVFTMGIPKKLASVQARFAESMGRQQQWVQRYTASLHLQPGQSLPYDKRMGITRAEYEELAKAYAKPVIIPLRSTAVAVIVRSGVTRFSAKIPDDFINDLSIDNEGILNGPRGFRCKPRTVVSQEAKFGSWHGTSWRSETENKSKGDFKSFELSVGRTDGSGRLFLHLQDIEIAAGKYVTNKQLLTWLERSLSR